MTSTEKPIRTGVFHRKSRDDYVVLWKGKEICTYGTIQEFVDAHKAGLEALEANQADLLESYYRTIGISSRRVPDKD